jgi:hypothetical protein
MRDIRGASMEHNATVRVSFTEAELLLAAEFMSIDPTRALGLRRFPTAAQYHERVARLLSQHGEQLSAVLPALAQRDWHVRGQTGCMFARLAALSADAPRWECIVAAPAANLDVPRLTSLIDAAIEDARIEVVSVLLPELMTAPDVVAVVRKLVAGGPFWLEVDRVVGDTLRLHLRYPFTASGGPVQSWVMAFGPYTWLPNTRQGPYLELVIRVKGKPDWIFHRLNQDRDVAHLADVPLDMTDRHWEHRWQSTRERTRMILGGEPDEISAAKCTLSVPIGELS